MLIHSLRPLSLWHSCYDWRIQHATEGICSISMRRRRELAGYGGRISIFGTRSMDATVNRRLITASTLSSKSLVKVVAGEIRVTTPGQSKVDLQKTEEAIQYRPDRKWRKGLLMLIAEIVPGVDLEAKLCPWIHDLTTEEWNKIISEVGNRHWLLAMSIFAFVKQKNTFATRLASNDGAGKLDENTCTSIGITNDTSAILNRELLTLYTTLVVVLSKNGRLSELKMIINDMSKENVDPDLHFYNAVAEAYSMFGMLSDVAHVRIQMERNGIQPDRISYEVMIAACLRARTPQLVKAIQVLRDMLLNNMQVGVKTFVRLIDSCIAAQNADAAEEVFIAMLSAGHHIYSKTWVKMIQLHASAGDYMKAESFLWRLRAAGFLPTASIYDALLLAYCQAGCVDQAFSVFREYKLAIKPSLIAYNCLIDASGKHGRHQESLALYSELKSNGLQPSVVTYNSVITTLVKSSQYERVDKLYQKMQLENISPSAYTFSTMINAYACCGWTKVGHEVCLKFRGSKIGPTIAIYGAMLKLYIHGRWYKEAASVVKEMEDLNMEPDRAGYGVIISVLGETGDEIIPLERAVEQSGWEPLRVAHMLLQGSSIRDSAGSSSSCKDARMESVSSILEAWASTLDKDWNLSLYNAYMDALWRRGLRRRAQLLMRKGRQLFTWYNRPYTGVLSVMDLRGLSVGGAQLALLDWLHEAGSGRASSCSLVSTMVVVTGTSITKFGSGRPVVRKGKGVGAVKQAVAAFLEEMCSPFKEAPHVGSGRYQAETVDVITWISRRESQDALRISDCN